MTHWSAQYLPLQYEDGARGPERYDCWGLVRHVRAAHMGCRLLPSFGHVRHTMPKEFTEAYQTGAASMEACPPEHGAIAAAMRGRICIHVAVVVEVEGRLYVLEMNPKTNVRLLPLRDFERSYLRVIYYRDRPNISQQA